MTRYRHEIDEPVDIIAYGREMNDDIVARRLDAKRKARRSTNRKRMTRQCAGAVSLVAIVLMATIEPGPEAPMLAILATYGAGILLLWGSVYVSERWGDE